MTDMESKHLTEIKVDELVLHLRTPRTKTFTFDEKNGV